MSQWPAPHWPSLRRRAWADRGLLLLAGAVVAVVTVVVAVAPPLMRATADAAVQTAVGRADNDAQVRVHAPWEGDYGRTGRIRAPAVADDLDDFRDWATRALSPELRAVLGAPVAMATSPTLKVTEGAVPRSFQLAYLASETNPGGPDVIWIEGGPPRSAVTPADRDIEVPYNGPPWPMQVGLSEANAALLQLHPGARVPVEDERRNVKHVEVSGIFRATDSTDPAWRLAPWLLRPIPAMGGVGSIRLGGLLSRDSLPDARLAFDQDDLPRTIVFGAKPSAFSQDSAGRIAASVVALKAMSGPSDDGGPGLQWESQLDGVLRDVRNQINAAFVQAAVLLIAVLTVTVLVLLLAADLLIRRRAWTLVAARQRGASLLDLGAGLMLESAALALLAAAAGLAVAHAITPGVGWAWAVPVVLAAAAASPAFGTIAAARATNDRRAPANRAARRWVRSTGQLRRAAVTAGALAAAVIALLALYQRGIQPIPVRDVTGASLDLAGGAVLPASAPALGALAGALIVLRLLPAGTRLMLRQALRSRRPLAVFGAARATATAVRVLPILVLLASAALASFAFTLDATARQGLVDGSWQTVGADARLDLDPAAAPELSELAERLAEAPDVLLAVQAQIVEQPTIAADSAIVTPRLVIVDAVAFARLLAATPLPDVPALDRLVAPGRGAVPALVRSGDGRLRPGAPMELLREGAPAISLVVVGIAPAIGDDRDVVLVDAATLAAAGQRIVPNTVWMTGPGAATAANAVAANAAGVTPVLRAEVERFRQTSPLTTGLLQLARTAAAILLALGVLGLAFGAAAGAPERWQTLARLRTLGLRPRDARWVAAGELLPPVVLAAAGGPLLGVLLARLTLGQLELGVLTGQTGAPDLVHQWWGVGLVAVAFVATVAVVVPTEAALRRRRRLAEVLRVGGA